MTNDSSQKNFERSHSKNNSYSSNTSQKLYLKDFNMNAINLIDYEPKKNILSP